MSRPLTAVVAAALALPVLALAALVGQQEFALAGAKVLSVPLRGYDPRDLLRGHYIVAQLDWDWEREPTGSPYVARDGAACIVATTPKPRIRFIPGWKPGKPVDADCRMVIAGRGQPGQDSQSARFTPANIEASDGTLKLFVPEERAAELERLVRARPGALTVDLAVRDDGSAALGPLRVDGATIER
jgi:uncharacterized membrane-anchored protein